MSRNDSSSERCTDRSTVLMISSIVDSDAMIVEVESTDQCAQVTIALQAAVLIRHYVRLIAQSQDYDWPIATAILRRQEVG